MEKCKGRVALVVGASAGIGAVISQDLVKAGMKVVGCARRVENIQELSDSLRQEEGKLYPVKCDLEVEDDIHQLFKTIEENQELGRIDVCIYNAGVSTSKGLVDETMKNWRKMMDVNFFGACLCTQKSVDVMRKLEINHGQIIFINSLAGHNVVDFKTTRFYSTTKYAMTALCEGWRQELRELGTTIRISQISPGYVESDFWDTMFKEDKALGQATKPASGLKASDISTTVQHILSTPLHMVISDIIVRPVNHPI